VVAKKYLVGLKDSALNDMVASGVIVRPIEKSLHESVLPWLIDKMSGFLNDEQSIDLNVE
jgi:hypothetical protein